MNHYPSIQERIASKAVPAVDCDCLIWTGSTLNGRYGRVFYEGESRTVHSVAWELFQGQKIPIDANTGKRFNVDHLIGPGLPCTSTMCVNPLHLNQNLVSGRENTYLFLERKNGSRDICGGCGLPLAGDNLAFKGKNHSRVCRNCVSKKGKRIYAKNVSTPEGRLAHNEASRQSMQRLRDRREAA